MVPHASATVSRGEHGEGEGGDEGEPHCGRGRKDSKEQRTEEAVDDGGRIELATSVEKEEGMRITSATAPP